MTAGIGIAVGTADSGAAVTSGSESTGDDTASVVVSHPTVVHLAADGTASLGSVPPETGRPGLSGFVDRVADPVGLLGADGRAHPGEDLFAAAVTCLSDEVRAADAGAADERTAIVVTHPAPWNTHTIRVLESALERTGMPPASLVSEATACLRWLESARGEQGDGVVVVYDLGAASLDVSVMRTGAEAGQLGRTLRSEDVTGAQFDHLVTRHVLDDLADSTTGFDPFDPAVVDALTDLRRNCAIAKEALSTDTEAIIPVALPGLDTDVRLVRAELEDLVRAPLTTSLELIREALRSADVEPGDVHHILLAGGGGAIPLVAELVSSELGLTVVAAPNPAHTAALGAALLAADAGARTAASMPTVPVPVAGPHDGSSVESADPVFPSRLRSTRSGSSARRRIAIIASSAAAIGVLTAGGLSIGTAGDPAPAQSTPSSPSAPGTDRAVADPGTTGTTESSPPGTVTVVGSTLGGTTMSPAAVAARGGAAPGVDPTGRALPQGAATTPATGDEGAAPTVDTAAPTDTPTQPAYTPPPAAGGGTPAPAPAPVQGPSPAQIGAGFGNAAEGLGQGVGAVLGGVGDVVGAVVDPVTGLLIGK